MADDIAEVARRWGDATGEMMANAVRDWNRDIDCPGLEIADGVYEMARALVHWCDSSGRPIDPTPITECMRFAHQTRALARMEDSTGAKSAFDSFGEEWSKCVAVLQRIQHAANEEAQREKIFPLTRDGINQDTIDIAMDIFDSDEDTPEIRRRLARKHFEGLGDCNERASKTLKDLRARESRGRIVLPAKRNKRNGAHQLN